MRRSGQPTRQPSSISRAEIDEFCEDLKDLAEEMKIADAMFEARNNSGRSEIAAKDTIRKVHR
jgi:hypothetical protein